MARTFVWRTAAAAALACALALGPACVPAATAKRSAPAERSMSLADMPPEVQELVRLVNQRRASRHCAGMRWDVRLAAVAQEHSEDMARRRYFAHVDPDGVHPAERLDQAGIETWASAENIACGYRTASQVLAGWLDSPGHKRNLDDCDYTHHGIGLDVRTRTWTHVFARYTPVPREHRGP